MNRFRSILGLVVGVLMILSAGAHSLLGWKLMRAELDALHASGELIGGLELGWKFGGVSMLTFGCIVLTLFARRLRGGDVSMLPANVIGATYVVYGAGALLASRLDPFFLVFAVPGVLLLIASIPQRPA